MKPIALATGLALFFEPCTQGVSLTVLKNGEPWVCRKATRRELESLLVDKASNVFKGRLRLRNKSKKIDVEVLKERVGAIPIGKFKEAVDVTLESRSARAMSYWNAVGRAEHVK